MAATVALKRPRPLLRYGLAALNATLGGFAGFMWGALSAMVALWSLMWLATGDKNPPGMGSVVESCIWAGVALGTPTGIGLSFWLTLRFGWRATLGAAAAGALSILAVYLVTLVY